MAKNAYYTNQYISTTLASVGGIDDSATTGIILASVTNITTDKPGIACLSYTDPIDTSKAEWITYTSIDSGTKELQGVTRGQEGYAAKSHSNGVTVAFPLSKSHINNLNDALIIGGDETNLVTGVIDDDTMATASATTLATSESTKAYIDNSSWFNGWNLVTETWTRTGNHTFTVAGDLTAKYRKGAKVRYKDGGAYEYGTVISSSYSSPNTTVTLATNTDYVMAAATITDTYISYIENPMGFPLAFNVTFPTFDTNTIDNGTGGQQPTGASAFFKIFAGNKLNLKVKLSGSGVVKNNTAKFFSFTIPTGLPAIVSNEATLFALGSCYFGSIDQVGVAISKSTTEIYFFNSDPITDNQALPSSNIDVTYSF